jgi:hypothetical protein
MKKAIYTIGLFSLVMILTSFTTPESNTSLDRAAVGGTVRLDRAAVGGTVRLDRAAVGGTVRLD